MEQEIPTKITYRLPLDDESLRIGTEIAHNLRVAITNIRLYPIDSPVTQNSVNLVFSSISKFLEKNKILVFAEAEGSLLLNGNFLHPHLSGKKQVSFHAFIETMISSHIRCLSFKVGLALNEFCSFLKTFSEKHWRRAGDIKVLTDLLKEKNILHIGINERMYVAVGDSDLLVERAREHLERQSGALNDLMKALEEVLEMSLLNEDGTVKDEAKVAIAEKILGLHPNLLVKFFEKKISPEMEKTREEVISGLPPHRLKEMIISIARLYKEIRDNTPPGSEKEAELVRLHQTFNRLLTSCKDKAISIEIYQQLAEDGLLDLLPPWWGKADFKETELVVSQARLLIEKDSLELLEDDVQGKLSGILKELDAMGKHELIDGLVKKIIENTKAGTGSVRLKTAKSLNKIIPTLETLSNKNVLESLINSILESIDRELDGLVYQQLAELFKRQANRYIKGGNYDSCATILATIRKHRRPDKTRFARRPESADKTLDEISQSEMLTILIEDLRSRDKNRQKDAYNVIMQFEGMATTPLIKALKETEDYGLRELIASLIKNIGKGAVSRLLVELDGEFDPVCLVRIIQILPSLKDESLVIGKLKRLIFHPLARVRLETVRCLKFFPTEKICPLLIDVLEDEEDFVKKEAINLLGEKNIIESLPGLTKIISSKSIFSSEEAESVQQETCLALSKLDQDEVVDILINTAKKTKRFSLKKTKSKGIRIAAIKALGSFNSTKIKEFLKEVSKDSDRYIARASQEVLDCLK